MGSCISISISFGNLFSVCQDCFVKKEENLDTLTKNLRRLTAIRDDVKHKVESEERRPDIRRLRQVELWLSNVELAETEVEKLKTESPQEIDDNLYLGGFCFKNLFEPNNEFGRRVTKWSKEVGDLLSAGENFSSGRQPLTGRIYRPKKRPCGTIIGSQSTFDEVWTCLAEEQVGVIGLYGMGGVGKTALLIKIHNELCERPNGFTVIWVTVNSHQPRDIQDEIGREIGLYDDHSWREKSVEDTALGIFSILSEKKFALFLDGIWEKVDLVKVGVPLPNSENKSKVVFTTRLNEVCGKMGDVQVFKVKCLRHDDSLELFESKVGKHTIESHHEIRERLAEAVAKECGGLPLALNTVAPAMACKNTLNEWKCAINVLKGLAYEFSGMEDQVLRFLKVSYDHLCDDTYRSCFLYCSLFPEDYRISRKELIDCWISEGISGDRNELQSDTIISDLVHACLLEEAEDNCIKMHDVIRDMALWIATKIEKEREGFFVRTSNELNEVTKIVEVPKTDESESIIRMSVIGHKIDSSLATNPAFPSLRTLFLNNNHLTMISGSFFQSMHSLLVLNLSNNPSLTYLPSEISKLVWLQHLNLSRTNIEVLPKQLESLVELKCLNLEHTSQLHTVPPKVISSFSKLQVLRMWECGSLSPVVDDNVLSNGAESLVEELLCLQHLKMLSITLKSDRALKIFFDSKELQNCTQSLCLRFLPLQKCLKALVADLKQLDTLDIRDCESVKEFQFDCSREVESFLYLHTVNISSCPKLRHLTWLVLARSLKCLVVSSCSKIKDIICVKKLADFPEKMQRKIPFEKIEYVELQRLQNLESIYWDPMPLQDLKGIKVICCPKLYKLPLGSNSAKERKIVIEGEQDWWDGLQWENPVTQNTFRPCFTSS